MEKSEEPRLSASVILLRVPDDKSQGYEIFLLKRSDRGGFMPGRFVFPGGSLEESDGTGEKGLRNCAIRELWEEAGVALTRNNGRTDQPGQEMLEAGRKRMEQANKGLDEALGEMGLEPAPELLVPFARWITPKARTKRFDTAFYLALLPQGQVASADLKETSEGVWLTPAQALEENRSGRVGLAAPQVRILGELSAFPTQEELFKKFSALDAPEPVRPILWSENGERVILLPWDRDHGKGSPASPAGPCPAAECTRLIHDRGRWLPFTCR